MFGSRRIFNTTHRYQERLPLTVKILINDVVA